MPAIMGTEPQKIFGTAYDYGSEDDSDDNGGDSDSDGDSDDSGVDDNQLDPKLEMISEYHLTLLRNLSQDDGVSLDEAIHRSETTATGKGGMNVLHRIFDFGSTPFNKFRPLVDKLLDSGKNQELLFTETGDHLTPLNRAINSRKWGTLECFLGHTVGLQSGKSAANQYLCEVINSLKTTQLPQNPKYFWKCIDHLISEPMKDFTMVEGDEGNTPLHLAVAYCGEIPLEIQKKLATKLIKASPESLNKCNAQGKSPYQYRMQSLPESSRATDPIAYRLKDYYMHYDNRDDAAKYLYGNGKELAMEFDLSEHEHTGYSLSEESREILGRHLKFESILRYVDFPRIVVEQTLDKQTETKSRGKAKQKELDGIGRKDLKAVFDWLRGSGVKKIIRVRVQDSQDPPHSDEIIETALQGFGIEIWDWVRIDLCSNTILNAAPNVTKVYLYSSGNNAVLTAWSGNDGLKKLKRLKRVNIRIYQRLESYQRTRELLERFERRLRDQIPDLTEFEGNVERLAGQQQLIVSNHLEETPPQQTHLWTDRMKDFVKFVEDLVANLEESPPGLPPRPVKVALIDDGVDGTHKILGNNIECGISFCTGPGSHSPVYSYCVPSGCHGTQMASLIRQVCPRVKLYVARIHDMVIGKDRQIDAASAVKGINWAINQEVDIISMSWTFEGNGDNRQILEGDMKAAINTAAGKNILMFCSTGDKGKCANHDIYPACLQSVFKIGAANSSGNEREWTEDSHFTLPGENLKVEKPTYINMGGDYPVAGSSLATALASGLAALMLYCIDVTGNSKLRERARNHTAMESAFKKMTAVDQPRYIGAWRYLKPELADIDLDEGMKKLEQAMELLFE